MEQRTISPSGGCIRYAKVLRVCRGQDAKNVIFLDWEPPDIFANPQYVEYTREKIEQLFADFNLALKSFPSNLVRFLFRV